jgi:hypothetical protein
VALDKDILGQAIYDIRNAFNNKTIDDILLDYPTIEDARLDIAKKEAKAIIDHFIANIKITIPATGLISAASGSPVTGSAVTGTIL